MEYLILTLSKVNQVNLQVYIKRDQTAICLNYYRHQKTK